MFSRLLQLFQARGSQPSAPGPAEIPPAENDPPAQPQGDGDVPVQGQNGAGTMAGAHSQQHGEDDNLDHQPDISPSVSPSVALGVGMKLDGWVKRPKAMALTAATAAHTNSEPSAFHLFASLPYDLRRRIWHTSMERHRLVHISHSSPGMVPPGRRLDADGVLSNDPVSNVSWHTKTRPPAVFAVCQESRHEALTFYRIHLPHQPAVPSTNSFLGGPAYINPNWDFVLYHVDGYAGTYPVDALLCNDLMSYDPLGTGVKHYGRKGSWRHWNGTFDAPKPLGAAYDLIRPLHKSLINLCSFTEMYELSPPSELQEVGGYQFPHWSRREAYFELETAPPAKSAYVLLPGSDGNEHALLLLGQMLKGIVSLKVADRVVLQTFHVMPTARAGLGIPTPGEHEGARIVVSQLGKLANMPFPRAKPVVPEPAAAGL